MKRIKIEAPDFEPIIIEFEGKEYRVVEKITQDLLKVDENDPDIARKLATWFEDCDVDTFVHTDMRSISAIFQAIQGAVQEQLEGSGSNPTPGG